MFYVFLIYFFSFFCGTGGCAVVRPWEAIVIGALGGGLAILSIFVLDKLKIDDPVGASSVHGTCGAWVSSSSFQESLFLV